MKKLKILGVISFTLIGGGALVSIPLAITSCKQKMKFDSSENFANFLRKHAVAHKEDGDFDYMNQSNPMNPDGTIDVVSSTKHEAFLSYFSSIKNFDCKEFFVSNYWTYVVDGDSEKFEINITKFSKKIVQWTFTMFDESDASHPITAECLIKWLDNGIYEMKSSAEANDDGLFSFAILNGARSLTETFESFYIFGINFLEAMRDRTICMVPKELYPNLKFSTLSLEPVA